ncbi:alpha/beta fold hydrolase [Mucilaginibacter gotjawali]|uniref:Pimeloyl-ACP methyl ester carboxylesterase n=2 Tax=Mucilaginibacter gotjawali TaxID=1550579 RepID=A0A839SGE7_9SPHI|nr:alpha/beta hydrolase [Mucilaginibacter gotjawali]MBB3056876.1 pimeloyl-ACP methyl ester carboxylesterase [Mucilaginibacter gotjawali]BAU55956.1 Arylesterase [Mucilaginibacter gotjawali]
MKKYTPVFILLLCLSSGLFAQPKDEGHYFTSFDSTKIYYEVKGDGYPVLLIHGFSGNGQGLKTCVFYDDLLKAGYKVILIDQRGNGRSDKPHNESAYANDAEAKDITGLVTCLHIKQYDVVGYSRGSIIASRLLVLDKRLHKAIMGGMGDAYTNPEWPRRVHAYRALMGDTSLHDVDDMVKYIHSQHFDELALALQQKYQPSTSPAELSKVKIPVLIIRGTEDKENGSETGLNKLIPGSALTYVPGNHNTAIHTREFSYAVIKFLAQ